MTGVSDRLDLPYTDERIRETVEEAVGHAEGQCRPRFYAVTGSHVYGFPSEASDVDVRGFHTAPADAYAYLDGPAEEVTVNMDGTTEGFENVADLDLRSYELRAFGELVCGANYNVVELVLEAPAVMNGVALEVDALRSLLGEYLPMNVPHSYFGMAKSNYYKHLDPEKPDSYDPRAKSFLYVIRGLLGAEYVREHGDVEADVTALAAELEFGLGIDGLVADLVEYKRTEGGHLPEDRAERARERVAELFNAVEEPGRADKEGFREDVDAWMRKVRR